MGDKYFIHLSQPFLNVLNTEGISIALTDRQVNYLKNTSIDYILCDNEGKPLIGIDFDGMLEGFSTGLDYHKSKSHPSLDEKKEKNRIDGFKLKLRIAHDSGFPLFIVGSKEFYNLSINIQLTLVDGIIGEVLAAKAFMENRSNCKLKIEDFFGKTGLSWSLYDEFISAYEDEDGEIIVEYDEVGKWIWRDWKSYLKRETNLETNPLDAKIKELRDCWAGFVVGNKSADTIIFDRKGELIYNNIEAEYLTNHISFNKVFYPSNSDLLSAVDLEVECVIETEEYGIIESTAKCPNFLPDITLSVLEKVAEIVALNKIINKVRK
jgi:hypothetical protein